MDAKIFLFIPHLIILTCSLLLSYHPLNIIYFNLIYFKFYKLPNGSLFMRFLCVTYVFFLNVLLEIYV